MLSFYTPPVKRIDIALNKWNNADEYILLLVNFASSAGRQKRTILGP